MALLAMITTGIAAHASSDEGDETGDYQRVVTVFDQGDRRALITKKTTVRALLESAQIPLFKDDKVEPSLDTQFDTDEFTINIYRAAPVVIVDGMRRERVMSIHNDPRDIAKYAGVMVRKEDELRLEQSTDVLDDGIGMRLVITRALPVKLVLYGRESTVYTQAKTVKDLLKSKKIKLASNDTLSVAPAEAITAGMRVEVWRNGIQTITEDQEIPFTVKQEKDPSKDGTYKQVKTKGKNGKKTITYEVNMRNGKEVDRKEIQSVVIEEPVEQVEVVGSKFNYTGGPLNDAQITALGMCESGMTATRNSGNGFYGAFQFMPSTWKKVAPAPYNNGLPHEAPLDAQKQAVQNLLSRSSIYTQFPGCAKKMQSQGIL